MSYDRADRQGTCGLVLPRKKSGIVRRTVTLTQNDLDALEVRGHLDPIDAATAPTNATRSRCSSRIR
jgi:hypothetical protein